MAKIERTYVIPLRREILKVPAHKRANKAVKAVKQFLVKHMKSGDVRLGKQLNDALWQNGMKNPPVKVEVRAVKEKDIVNANLVGVTPKAQPVKESTPASEEETLKKTEKSEGETPVKKETSKEKEQEKAIKQEVMKHPPPEKTSGHEHASPVKQPPEQKPEAPKNP